PSSGSNRGAQQWISLKCLPLRSRRDSGVVSRIPIAVRTLNRNRPPQWMTFGILVRSMVCDEARLTEAAPVRFAPLDCSAAGGFGSVARELVDFPFPHARGRSVKPRNYYIEGDAGLATEVPFFCGTQYVQGVASLAASTWGL